MLEYRDFLSLTDEEITFIISDIFPDTPRVDNIERDTKWNRISCDIYIMEEYPDIPDTLDLTPDDITTHDFEVDKDDVFRWQQYLLAKGCDERLKDNPYLAETNISIQPNYNLKTHGPKGMVVFCENEENYDSLRDAISNTGYGCELYDLQNFNPAYLVSPLREGMIIHCETKEERIALYEELCNIGNMTDRREDSKENFIDSSMDYRIKNLSWDVWGFYDPKGHEREARIIPFKELFPEKDTEKSIDVDDEMELD